MMYLYLFVHCKSSFIDKNDKIKIKKKINDEQIQTINNPNKMMLHTTQQTNNEAKINIDITTEIERK